MKLVAVKLCVFLFFFLCLTMTIWATDILPGKLWVICVPLWIENTVLATAAYSRFLAQLRQKRLKRTQQ